MSPQLAALFAAHKTAILGTGAAAIAGLALLQKRKTAAAAAAGGTAQPAGTIPAAAVVPTSGTTGSGYDSSVTDLYNALQPELDALRQTSGSTGTGVSAAPAPIASSLFAPTGSGNYVLYQNGSVAEVESDGSQLGLYQPQWNALLAQGAKATPIPVASVAPGSAYYETGTNLAGVKKPGTP